MKTYFGCLSFEADSLDEYLYTIELCQKNIEYIQNLQNIVKQQDVYEISFFHSCLNAYRVTETAEDILKEIQLGEEVRTDVVVVHVGGRFIRITGVLKHDHHTFSTGIFGLEDMYDDILDNIYQV